MRSLIDTGGGYHLRALNLTSDHSYPSHPVFPSFPYLPRPVSHKAIVFGGRRGNKFSNFRNVYMYRCIDKEVSFIIFLPEQGWVGVLCKRNREPLGLG
jgi:hypothetical protein